MSVVNTQALGVGDQERPTWGKVLAQTAPLAGATFYGPPVISVLGPWLLVVLLLIGPIALIVTVLLVLVIAVGLLAVCVAVIACPYLLVRHRHADGTVRGRPVASLHLLPNHRVSSGRLGSQQPKGVS